MKSLLAGLSLLFLTLIVSSRLYWKEMSYKEKCISNLDAASIEIRKVVLGKDGNVPVQNPLPAILSTCPKNSKLYLYKKTNNGGPTVEDGFGFKILCPEKHYDYLLCVTSLSVDFSEYKIPVRSWK